MSQAALAITAPPAPDELEAQEDAIREIDKLIAHHAIALADLQCRRAELLAGAQELRRARARNRLDAYLPPLRILAFDAERVDVPPASEPLSDHRDEQTA